jgi:hypothetical protein
VPELSDAAVASGIEGSVMVCALRPVLLKDLRAAALALTIALRFEQPIRDVVRLDVRQIRAFNFLATSILGGQAHGEGMAIYARALHEPGYIRSPIEAGMDGIVSDYPDRAVAALRAYKPSCPAALSPPPIAR